MDYDIISNFPYLNVEVQRALVNYGQKHLIYSGWFLELLQTALTNHKRSRWSLPIRCQRAIIDMLEIIHTTIPKDVASKRFCMINQDFSLVEAGFPIEQINEIILSKFSYMKTEVQVDLKNYCIKNNVSPEHIASLVINAIKKVCLLASEPRHSRYYPKRFMGPIELILLGRLERDPSDLVSSDFKKLALPFAYSKKGNSWWSYRAGLRNPYLGILEFSDSDSSDFEFSDEEKTRLSHIYKVHRPYSYPQRRRVPWKRNCSETSCLLPPHQEASTYKEGRPSEKLQGVEQVEKKYETANLPSQDQAKAKSKLSNLVEFVNRQCGNDEVDFMNADLQIELCSSDTTVSTSEMSPKTDDQAECADTVIMDQSNCTICTDGTDISATMKCEKAFAESAESSTVTCERQPEQGMSAEVGQKSVKEQEEKASTSAADRTVDSRLQNAAIEELPSDGQGDRTESGDTEWLGKNLVLTPNKDHNDEKGSKNEHVDSSTQCNIKPFRKDAKLTLDKGHTGKFEITGVEKSEELLSDVPESSANIQGINLDGSVESPYPGLGKNEHLEHIEMAKVETMKNTIGLDVTKSGDVETGEVNLQGSIDEEEVKQVLDVDKSGDIDDNEVWNSTGENAERETAPLSDDQFSNSAVEDLNISGDKNNDLQVDGQNLDNDNLNIEVWVLVLPSPSEAVENLSVLRPDKQDGEMTQLENGVTQDATEIEAGFNSSGRNQALQDPAVGYSNQPSQVPMLVESPRLIEVESGKPEHVEEDTADILDMNSGDLGNTEAIDDDNPEKLKQNSDPDKSDSETCSELQSTEPQIELGTNIQQQTNGSIESKNNLHNWEKISRPENGPVELHSVSKLNKDDSSVIQVDDDVKQDAAEIGPVTAFHKNECPQNPNIQDINLSSINTQGLTSDESVKFLPLTSGESNHSGCAEVAAATLEKTEEIESRNFKSDDTEAQDSIDEETGTMTCGENQVYEKEDFKLYGGNEYGMHDDIHGGSSKLDENENNNGASAHPSILCTEVKPMILNSPMTSGLEKIGLKKSEKSDELGSKLVSNDVDNITVPGIDTSQKEEEMKAEFRPHSDISNCEVSAMEDQPVTDFISTLSLSNQGNIAEYLNTSAVNKVNENAELVEENLNAAVNNEKEEYGNDLNDDEQINQSETTNKNEAATELQQQEPGIFGSGSNESSSLKHAEELKSEVSTSAELAGNDNQIYIPKPSVQGTADLNPMADYETKDHKKQHIMGSFLNAGPVYQSEATKTDIEAATDTSAELKSQGTGMKERDSDTGESFSSEDHFALLADDAVPSPGISITGNEDNGMLLMANDGSKLSETLEAELASGASSGVINNNPTIPKLDIPESGTREMEPLNENSMGTHGMPDLIKRNEKELRENKVAQNEKSGEINYILNGDSLPMDQRVAANDGRMAKNAYLHESVTIESSFITGEDGRENVFGATGPDITSTVLSSLNDDAHTGTEYDPGAPVPANSTALLGDDFMKHANEAEIDTASSLSQRTDRGRRSPVTTRPAHCSLQDGDVNSCNGIQGFQTSSESVGKGDSMVINANTYPDVGPNFERNLLSSQLDKAEHERQNSNEIWPGKNAIEVNKSDHTDAKADTDSSVAHNATILHVPPESSDIKFSTYPNVENIHTFDAEDSSQLCVYNADDNVPMYTRKRKDLRGTLPGVQRVKREEESKMLQGADSSYDSKDPNTDNTGQGGGDSMTEGWVSNTERDQQYNSYSSYAVPILDLKGSENVITNLAKEPIPPWNASTTEKLQSLVKTGIDHAMVSVGPQYPENNIVGEQLRGPNVTGARPKIKKLPAKNKHNDINVKPKDKSKKSRQKKVKKSRILPRVPLRNSISTTEIFRNSYSVISRAPGEPTLYYAPICPIHNSNKNNNIPSSLNLYYGMKKEEAYFGLYNGKTPSRQRLSTNGDIAISQPVDLLSSHSQDYMHGERVFDRSGVLQNPGSNLPLIPMVPSSPSSVNMDADPSDFDFGLSPSAPFDPDNESSQLSSSKDIPERSLQDETVINKQRNTAVIDAPDVTSTDGKNKTALSDSEILTCRNTDPPSPADATLGTNLTSSFKTATVHRSSTSNQAIEGKESISNDHEIDADQQDMLSQTATECASFFQCTDVEGPIPGSIHSLVTSLSTSGHRAVEPEEQLHYELLDPDEIPVEHVGVAANEENVGQPDVPIQCEDSGGGPPSTRDALDPSVCNVTIDRNGVQEVDLIQKASLRCYFCKLWTRRTHLNDVGLHVCGDCKRLNRQNRADQRRAVTHTSENLQRPRKRYCHREQCQRVFINRSPTICQKCSAPFCSNRCHWHHIRAGCRARVFFEDNEIGVPDELLEEHED